MFYRIKILYQTTDGHYRTAFRDLDHSDTRQSKTFVENCLLSDLPNGAMVLRLETDWSATASHPLIMRRLENQILQ
jgi:hypothetical protein